MGLSSKNFEFVRHLIRTQASLAIETGKEYLVEARLEPVAKNHGYKSLDDMIDFLHFQPLGALHHEIVMAMTTGETSFFRDLHPFETIKKIILPDLIKRRAGDKTLRIWSCGCSTGQEPVTLAMILRDTFPEIVSDWNISILATDLSHESIEKARKGVFNGIEIKRGLPPLQQSKYFEPHGKDWQVKDTILKMIEYRELNLAHFPWPSWLLTQDLVLIRNVMIYFEDADKEKTVNALKKNLRPKGYLMLGSTEGLFHMDEGLERHQVGNTIYYQAK